MEVIVAKSAGFCIGVKKAVETAFALKGDNFFVLGELIHNKSVIDKLTENNIKTVESLDEIKSGTVLIRSHGVALDVYEKAKAKGLEIIDCTCSFVAKIQKKVKEFFDKGYHIIIIGEKNHPEVIGINGWCENTAMIITSINDAFDLKDYEKICVVAQTTQNPIEFDKIIKKILISSQKTVEVFNTICYTTIERNKETEELSRICDCVIVVGGFHSSNTKKLYDISCENCKNVFWVESALELDYKKVSGFKKVAVLAGASTPIEDILEVKQKMDEVTNNEEQKIESKDSVNENIAENLSSKPELSSGEVNPGSELNSKEEISCAKEETGSLHDIVSAGLSSAEKLSDDASKELKLDEQVKSAERKKPLKRKDVAIDMNSSEDISMEQVISHINATENSSRIGQRVKTTVVLATDEGLMLQIGAKKGEVLLLKEEINLEGAYDKTKFRAGDEIDVVITGNSPLTVSQKAKVQARDRVQKPREPREPEPNTTGLNENDEFKVNIDSFNKGGLVGKYNSAEVFIPASQIRLGFVKLDELDKYVGKELKVRAIKIEGRKIIASQKAIIEEEKKTRDFQKQKIADDFFADIEQGKIVSGKVARFTDFGAFITVNGFDCLAHISDLSYKGVKKPDEILTKDETYNFLVLKIDKEKQQVSLGYKQLQPKPWDLASEKYKANSTVKGKVVRLTGFGAFVEIEPGIDGLIHVSQISNEWIENPMSALSVGQEITAMILDVNPGTEKMTLSIKALSQAPAHTEKTESKETGGNFRKRTGSEKASDFKEGKPRKPREDGGPKEWVSEENGGASIGDLLKGFKININ